MPNPKAPTRRRVVHERQRPVDAVADRLRRHGLTSAEVDEFLVAWTDFDDEDRESLLRDLAALTDDQLRALILAERGETGPWPEAEPIETDPDAVVIGAI